MASFERFWGFSAVVASMPHHACLAAVGDMLYDMGFIAFDNTHIESSPLLSTLRVGFEPCCIPLSVERARRLVQWTMDEDDGLINVQAHAQNFHSSTTPAREYMRRMQEVVELVLHLRRTYPRMVFVTVSELMQLKAQGWSREVWPDRLVYRNHNSDPIFVPIDVASRWIRKPAWPHTGRPAARHVHKEGSGQEGVTSRGRQEEAQGGATAAEPEADAHAVWAVYVHQVLYGTQERDVASDYRGRPCLGEPAACERHARAQDPPPPDFECRVFAEGEALELLPARYYAVLRASRLAAGAETPDVRDCAAWRERVLRSDREGAWGVERRGEESAGGELGSSKAGGRSGATAAAAGEVRKRLLRSWAQEQGSTDDGPSPAAAAPAPATEECFPNSVTAFPDILVAGRPASQKIVVREAKSGGGGGCARLSDSGGVGGAAAAREEAAHGGDGRLWCQFWREIDGLDLGATALRPVQEGVGSSGVPWEGECEVPWMADPVLVKVQVVREQVAGRAGEERRGALSVVWGGRSLLYSLANMAQRQPQTLQPPRLATDAETVSWLTYKDTETALKRGLRVCIMCGSERIPGWIHLEQPQALGEPHTPASISTFRTQPSSSPRAANASLPPAGRKDGVGRGGGAAEGIGVAWRLEMGLGFVADEAVSFISVGPELLVDWSDGAQVCARESARTRARAHVRTTGLARAVGRWARYRPC